MIEKEEATELIDTLLNRGEGRVNPFRELNVCEKEKSTLKNIHARARMHTL
jgi:hypothetical protein